MVSGPFSPLPAPRKARQSLPSMGRGSASGEWATFCARDCLLGCRRRISICVVLGPQLTDSSRSYHPGGTNAIGRAILLCLDKRTGHAAKFTIANPVKVIAKFGFTGQTVGLWGLRTQKTYSPANYSGQPRYSASDVGETTDAIGLAVANQRVYVAMHDDNQILVFDANTANQVDQIPVPAPAGLFAEPNHSILAVSNQHIVRINPANRQVQTVVSSGLVAPRCVTEDQKNRIYVSDWGSSFQVKVFSSSGASQRSIGKEGGRPWVGPWDHNGMLVPTGIAVSGDGKLWVAEDDSSPSRVSVWNPDTGALVKEYLGPTAYGGAWIDDRSEGSDPTRMGWEHVSKSASRRRPGCRWHRWSAGWI